MTFLELPMAALLCSVQQTCKQGKAVIEVSVRLQQHLFFKPIPATPPELISIDLPDERWVAPDTGATYIGVCEHPLITRLIGQRHVSLDHFKRRMMSEPGAIWRRALVTQPPIPKLSVDWTSNGKHCEITGNGVGVRLEELLKDEPALRQLYGLYGMDIRGWESWRDYEGYHQLEQVKTEHALGGNR